MSSLVVSWLGFNKCGRDSKEWSGMSRTSGRGPTTNKTTCQWTTTGLIKKWRRGVGGGVFNFGRCLWGPQWVGKWGLHPPPPKASHHWRTGWWHSIRDSLTEGMILRVWRGWFTNKVLKRSLGVIFNFLVGYTTSVRSSRILLPSSSVFTEAYFCMYYHLTNGFD